MADQTTETANALLRFHLRRAAHYIEFVCDQQAAAAGHRKLTACPICGEPLVTGCNDEHERLAAIYLEPDEPGYGPSIADFATTLEWVSGNDERWYVCQGPDEHDMRELSEEILAKLGTPDAA